MAKNGKHNLSAYLTSEERAEVQRLVESSTLDAVAKRLEVATGTLRTIAAGLRAQRGTLLLVRQGLAALRAKGHRA